MKLMPTISFYSALRREVTRFWSIKRQTLLTPVLETYLYITVFGAALGSRINELEGFRYIVFVVPGLIMMSMAMNAFGNNSATVSMQKIQRAIDDQLASPITNFELFAAFTLGGFIRAAIIATLTFVTADILIHLPIAHPIILIASLGLVGLFFAILGTAAGLSADKFDTLNLYQNFILQPLIFLSGVFYSTRLLPPFAEHLSHYNPIFYMINAVRYGMLGHSDTNPYIALGILFLATLLLGAFVYRLFQIGYKLRF